jgi:hypothetical protein
MEEIMKRARPISPHADCDLRDRAPAAQTVFPGADEATLADKKKVTTAVLDKLAESGRMTTPIVDLAKKVVVEATDFRA